MDRLGAGTEVEDPVGLLRHAGDELRHDGLRPDRAGGPVSGVDGLDVVCIFDGHFSLILRSGSRRDHRDPLMGRDRIAGGYEISLWKDHSTTRNSYLMGLGGSVRFFASAPPFSNSEGFFVDQLRIYIQLLAFKGFFTVPLCHFHVFFS